MQLAYEMSQNIGRITLVNPPYNTLTDPVFAKAEQLTEFLEQPELRAVVVRGGGRHFCSGADLAHLREQVGQTGFAQRLDAGKQLLDLLRYATVPVVAAISGSALGAGLEIALACHFRVAARNAMLGFPEVDHGLMPGFGGTLAARNNGRFAPAAELILTGKLVRGEEALAAGLVHMCVPARELESATATLVGSLIRGRPAHQIRTVMTALHNASRLPRDRALREETVLFCRLAAQAASDDGV